METDNKNMCKIYELSVHKSEDDTVELLKNSDPTIYYKLIPFEQGEEIWINHDKKTFMDYKNVNELPDINETGKNNEFTNTSYHFNPNHKVKDIFDEKYRVVNKIYTSNWINDMKVHVCEYGKKYDTHDVILISKNNKILSGFKCYDDQYQQGDGSTVMFIDTYTNDLIIFNDGDVSSAIIVKLLI